MPYISGRTGMARLSSRPPRARMSATIQTPSSARHSRADRTAAPGRGRSWMTSSVRSRSTSANSPRSSKVPCRNDRLSRPASAARADAAAIAWLEGSIPITLVFGNACATVVAATPAPHPMSTTVAPAWRRSVMASIESRMTGTRKAFCPPAPIAAWKWHVSAPCSSQVMPMPLENASIVRSISCWVMGGPKTPA